MPDLIAKHCDFSGREDTWAEIDVATGRERAVTCRLRDGKKCTSTDYNAPKNCIFAR